MILAPANIDFLLVQGNAVCKGSDWEVTVTISDITDGIETPVDLTGYTGECNIRKTTLDTDPLIASPIVTVSNPVNGELKLSLDASNTILIPTQGTSYSEVERYQYEVKLTDPDGEKQRIMHGYIEVSPTAIKEAV